MRARVVALGACTRLPAAAAEAEQIHVLLVKYGVPRATSDVHACTFLVRAYARFSRMRDARKVFERMPNWTVVSWNVLLDALRPPGGGWCRRHAALKGPATVGPVRG